MAPRARLFWSSVDLFVTAHPGPIGPSTPLLRQSPLRRSTTIDYARLLLDRYVGEDYTFQRSERRLVARRHTSLTRRVQMGEIRAVVK